MLLQGSENYRSWEKKHKTQWRGREKKKTNQNPQSQNSTAHNTGSMSLYQGHFPPEFSSSISPEPQKEHLRNKFTAQ